MRFDVAVVGAGISGSATAYELALRGHRVVLIDQYGPAAMASGWTLAGVRQSGRHPAEVPLAKRAVELWQDLAERLDGPTHYRQVGNLRCARDEGEVQRIRTVVAEHEKAGLEMQLLEGAAVRDAVPVVSERVLAASFCPSDGHADPSATVGAFVAAGERHGVVTRFGERVEAVEIDAGGSKSVRTSAGRYDVAQVVLATGVHGNELIAPFDLRVPFEVMSATMLRSVPTTGGPLPVIGVANGDTTLRQEVGGEFRFGGGHEAWDGQAQYDPRPQVRPTTDSVLRILESVRSLVPMMANVRVDRVWCGLIDQTVDALPVLDVLPEAGGLVLATGFSGHGFCLGPVTGQILADLAEGRASELPIDPFRLSRFNSHRGHSTPVELHG